MPRHLLAAGPFARVDLCDCGAIHLTVGAVTMRLTADALPLLAEVIGDGARELTLRLARGGLDDARAGAFS